MIKDISVQFTVLYLFTSVDTIFTGHSLYINSFFDNNIWSRWESFLHNKILFIIHIFCACIIKNNKIYIIYTYIHTSINLHTIIHKSY